MTAPNRRWFQFRLRTFLVLMVAAGATLGLGVREVLRRRDEELDRQQTKQALQEAWLRNDRMPRTAVPTKFKDGQPLRDRDSRDRP